MKKMPEFEDEDMEFIEKVIEKNREGLERLAEEEDAAEKRDENFSKKLKRLLKKLKEMRGKDEEAASFSKID